MSTFQVSIRKISEIWPHGNADRLELARVDGLGYQFCSQKGTKGVGDEVVYFPVDSVLPERLAEALGVRNLLSGKNKDRIKTVKLRGEISQGLVVKTDVIKDYLAEIWPGLEWPPSDLTGALGVTKYEPPEIPCHAGRLSKLPDGVSMYDIEGADNFPDALESLMDQVVVVSEKMEGTNYSVTCMPDGETVFVNQRKHTIIPIEDGEHDFWRVSRVLGVLDSVKRIQGNNFPGQQLTLRGELVGPGIQKNIYKLKEKKVLFFDVLVDGKYLPFDTYFDICGVYGLETVPILSYNKTLREWLDGRSLQEASNGKSTLSDVAREGVVIKPLEEQSHPGIGRLILKQRSPDYLAKSEF